MDDELDPGKASASGAGRDKTQLLAGLEKQLEAVRAVSEAIAPAVPVRACLCFVDAEMPLWRRLRLRGHELTQPRRLARMLNRRGELTAEQMRFLSGPFLDPLVERGDREAPPGARLQRFLPVLGGGLGGSGNRGSRQRLRRVPLLSFLGRRAFLAAQTTTELTSSAPIMPSTSSATATTFCSGAFAIVSRV